MVRWDIQTPVDARLMPEKRRKREKGAGFAAVLRARRKRKPVDRDREEGRLYTKYASVYDLFFDHVLRAGRKAAVAMLDARPGDRILEVGVGTGLSFRYYPHGVRVTGIDVSSKMLEEARLRQRRTDRIDVDLVEMDAMRLEFVDGSFDKIMASHVLSAVPDARAAWSEIKRVCAPGGTIVIANRFRSKAPMFRAAEKAVNPLTRRFGFILDLPLDLFTEDETLRVDAIRKVNLPGLWRVVRLIKTANGNGAP